MPPLLRTRLLHRSKKRIFRLDDETVPSETEEQVMIPLVPITRDAPVPTAGRWNLADVWRDMLRSWIAHHQRMADLGLHGGL